MVLARAAERLPLPDAMPGGTVYEPKWDGFRALIIRRDNATTLRSRNGTDMTVQFPEVVAAAHEQIPDGFTLDGELVAWSGDRLDFDALQARVNLTPRNAAAAALGRPASFVAFDVLDVAGRDVRRHPLSVRRALLDELAATWVPPLHLSPCTADRDEAQRWLSELAPAGVEGIVAKGLGEAYLPGQRRWVKVKHRRTVDAVAGAVTGSVGRPRQLVVGRYRDGVLRVAGRTTLLDRRQAAVLTPMLVPARLGHPWPDVLPPSRFARSSQPTAVVLIEPLVVEVAADTAGFRHPVRFVRARPDVDPEGVTEPD